MTDRTAVLLAALGAGVIYMAGFAAGRWVRRVELAERVAGAPRSLP